MDDASVYAVLCMLYCVCACCRDAKARVSEEFFLNYFLSKVVSTLNIDAFLVHSGLAFYLSLFLSQALCLIDTTFKFLGSGKQ